MFTGFIFAITSKLIKAFDLPYSGASLDSLTSKGGLTGGESVLQNLLGALGNVKGEESAKAKSNLIDCLHGKDGNYHVDGIRLTSKAAEFDQGEFQRCVAATAKQSKELAQKIAKFIKAETSKNQTSTKKKECVTKLNTTQINCYREKVSSDFVNKPKWIISSHKNVHQVWMDNLLVQQFVIESPEYVLTKKQLTCPSFFSLNDSLITANLLGSVISAEGKFATQDSKGKRSCKPCSEYLDNKSGEKSARLNVIVDGQYEGCDRGCDPMQNILFGSSDNLVVVGSSKKDKKNKSKGNKKKKSE